MVPGAQAAQPTTLAAQATVATQANHAVARQLGTANGRSVQTANGLIIQLHGASPNVPDALKATPQLAKAPVDVARWDRLLHQQGLNPATITRQPVGARAQLIGWGRRLSAAEAATLAAQWAALPEVAWALPNVREQRLQSGPGGGGGGAGALNPPNDPLFATAQQQWWLQPVSGSNANAIEMRLRGVPGFQSAWFRHTGDRTVAVLDSGVTTHPELVGRLLPGHDFVSDWDASLMRGYANDGDGRDADPSDPGDAVTEADRQEDPARYANCAVQPSGWHGTIVAGMLAANTHNGDGVAAMQWQAQVVPVRVAGRCGADIADVIDGMRWAAGLPVAGAPLNAHPARIINMSFGADAACPAAYAQAIAEIAQAPGGGALLVAAGGNTFTALARPANCPGAVGVVALNRDGFKANYASFGPEATIATVGGDDADGLWGPLLADSGILTLTNLGASAPGAPGYGRAFGSSFAAPLVSGVLGLMTSINPALTPAELVAGLRLTARPHASSPWLAACSAAVPGRCACTNDTCGAGLLDAEQATLYAAHPAGYVKPATAGAVLDHQGLRDAAALGPDRAPTGGATPGAASGAASSGGGSLGWGGALGLALALGLLCLARRWPHGFFTRRRNP